ncbi:eukaryotic translation initiation factor 3 subunit E [Linnemannia schmuckeri]|uniref:Eukaryotic translation initiation factor 3 subunit E n=1 Tax=Linnemannia schmuckeri TaxID=64567 RepID=A0A9P5VDC5_9FUNG|nr:eukaryotic translation initiation factor 3 subunit E [Linnemannia schmuckeri]
MILTVYTFAQFQYSGGNYGGSADRLYYYRVLPAYINAIQTSCPWILRYLTAVMMVNKRRKNFLKALYKDPITEFVEALSIELDFELVKKKLAECEDVLENDSFLVSIQQEFIQSARFLISETYYRIHQKIVIAELSQTLNMSKEDGEKWIVNLIQDTRVDAKICYQENAVLMNNNIQSVYRQIIEKTERAVVSVAGVGDFD